jgi:hypothetical protein
MNSRIFTIAVLAWSLASAGHLPAQENRNSNTRQPTLEDRIGQLEQDEQNLKSQANQLRNDVADLQDRVKRLEEGKQLPQAPPPAAHSGAPAEAPIQPRCKGQIPEHSNLMMSFIKACSQMATGLTTPLMEKSGNLTSRLQMATGDPTATGTGPIRTKVGLGFRMKISAGQRTTTGVGHGAVTLVGFGFPGADGLRLGSPGEKVAIMWVGPRYLRRWQMTRKHGWEAGSITTMTSVP